MCDIFLYLKPCCIIASSFFSVVDTWSRHVFLSFPFFLITNTTPTVTKTTKGTAFPDLP